MRGEGRRDTEEQGQTQSHDADNQKRNNKEENARVAATAAANQDNIEAQNRAANRDKKSKKQNADEESAKQTGDKSQQKTKQSKEKSSSSKQEAETTYREPKKSLVYFGAMLGAVGIGLAIAAIATLSGPIGWLALGFVALGSAITNRFKGKEISAKEPKSPPSEPKKTKVGNTIMVAGAGLGVAALILGGPVGWLILAGLIIGVGFGVRSSGNTPDDTKQAQQSKNADKKTLKGDSEERDETLDKKQQKTKGSKADATMGRSSESDDQKTLERPTRPRPDASDRPIASANASAGAGAGAGPGASASASPDTSARSQATATDSAQKTLAKDAKTEKLIDRVLNKTIKKEYRDDVRNKLGLGDQKRQQAQQNASAPSSNSNPAATKTERTRLSNAAAPGKVIELTATAQTRNEREAQMRAQHLTSKSSNNTTSAGTRMTQTATGPIFRQMAHNNSLPATARPETPRMVN